MSLLFSYLIAKNGRLQLENGNGEIEDFDIAYGTILAFATGVPFPPPSGFVPTPTIAFQDSSPYPRSNTCGNTLYLPVGRPLLSQDQFAYCMAYGILNAAGFGRV